LSFRRLHSTPLTTDNSIGRNERGGGCTYTRSEKSIPKRRRLLQPTRSFRAPYTRIVRVVHYVLQERAKTRLPARLCTYIVVRSSWRSDFGKKSGGYTTGTRHLRLRMEINSPTTIYRRSSFVCVLCIYIYIMMMYLDDSKLCSPLKPQSNAVHSRCGAVPRQSQRIIISRIRHTLGKTWNHRRRYDTRIHTIQSFFILCNYSAANTYLDAI